ncbi:unnamed protein product [Symbiodinium necroappetens]|uniref:Uncharacterized protein n=1 Tax=Symbiodinium necroappetens TaxID=1628268 RepID=A0A813BAB7_9DINO|nr:unnamed protein product [Symbiodinium necroappetens]
MEPGEPGSSQDKRPLEEDSDDQDLQDQSEVEDLLEIASEAPTDTSWAGEVDEAELDGEILIEEPQARPRKKKSLDAAALAARRVCKRLRQERKAARKAKRKAEAKAKKRRGFGADLEGFLVKTKERLETKALEAEALAAAAVMAEAEVSRPKAEAPPKPDLRGFVAKTRERLLARSELEKATEEARRAKAAALAANVDLESFRKECQARIAQRLLAKMPQIRGAEKDAGNINWACITRRRIAIVGAGPVGLWAAMLLAQKYRWTDGTGCARLRPDAPEVVLFEARSMENHCTRTDIRIALSSSTRAMLDQQTKSRSFTSGMPVAEIEDTFLRRWKKVAGQEARIGYGSSISDPAELCQSGQFDCILWAAGRRSLDDPFRKDLGCEVKIGDSQRVLVFQVQDLQGADAWQLGSMDLSGAAQQAGRFPGLRVMLRPGFEGACACCLVAAKELLLT